EGELAWRRVLERRAEPFASLGDDEVQGILSRFAASKGGEEFHLKEIYLSAGPDRAQQVVARERQMIEDIQQGTKPFEYFVQSSEATTRSTGGDLGWLNEADLNRLPDGVANMAKIMREGEVAGPIAVPRGFSILYLVDTRRALEPDPLEARLTLEQLS